MRRRTLTASLGAAAVAVAAGALPAPAFAKPGRQSKDAYIWKNAVVNGGGVDNTNGYLYVITSHDPGPYNGSPASTDGGGGRWFRINDDDHQWASAGSAIAGDPHIFGRVYLSARGVIYGDIAD